MKNLKLVFCGLILSAIVISCQKNNINGGGPTYPRTVHEDSIRAFLKGKTWKYFEYFHRYDSSATDLVWKIGKSNSTNNLNLDRVTYLTDSTYKEIDASGTLYTGTWSLLGGGSQIQVVNALGTFTSNIVKLSNTEFQWYEPSTFHYGFMVPDSLAPDTTGGRLAVLTSHIWIYDEYFSGYNTNPTRLIYKRGKSNSPLNLNLNQAQFNTNGTYWEIDQNGTFYSGTWSFLNGQSQIQVVNSLGTFTSNIRRLDHKRFEWQDLPGGTWGEEVPQ